MTTILYFGGVLAVDSQASAHGAHVSNISKLLEIDGRHFAISGDLGHVAGFVRDLVAGKPWADGLPDNAGVPVELRSNHRLRVYSGRGYVDVEPTDYYAAGSGAEAALGAMHAGVGVIEALRACSKVDVYTAAPFHAVRYDDATQSFIKWKVDK